MDTPRASASGTARAFLAGRRARLLAALTVALTGLAVLASTALAVPRFGSGPVAERNLNGNLEVFTSDFDGDILHMWQLSPGGSWSNWAEMPFRAQFALARPAVARNKNGRMEVFAQSGTRMYHNYQLAAGGSWSGWLDFGGGFAGTIFTQPVATAGPDGHLEVFAVNPNGNLVRRYQLAPGGAWSGWQNLGGNFHPEAIPAVNLTWDGKLEVFVLDGNGAVQHRWQLAPGGSWSGWASLGGNFLNGEGWGVAVARNQDGRLEVFATGHDRQLYHRWQTVKGGGWGTGWASLGGFIDRPVAVRHIDGRLEVVADTNGGPHGSTVPTQVRHITQLTPGGGWSGWGLLGDGGPGTYEPAAVATNADGRLEVFLQQAYGMAMYHSWQHAPGGFSSWSSFSPLLAG